MFGKKKRAEDQNPDQMTVTGKNKKKGILYVLREDKPWLLWGLIVSLFTSVVLTSFYGVFRSNAEKHKDNPRERYSNIEWLYQNCFLLYRDLYNLVNQTQYDYDNVYLEADKGYEWLLTLDSYPEYETGWDNYEYEDQSDSDPGNPAGTISTESDSMESNSTGSQNSDAGTMRWVSEDEYSEVRSDIDHLMSMLELLDNSFFGLNQNYDYVIKDHVTGKCVTNMADAELESLNDEKYFLLSFSFDENGNVFVEDLISGENPSQIRKHASEIVRENSFFKLLENYMDDFTKYGEIRKPVDCTVTYAVSRDALERQQSGNYYLISHSFENDQNYTTCYIYTEYSYSRADSYLDAGVGGIVVLCIMAVFLLGWFLPVLKDKQPYRDEKICSLPFEILFTTGVCMFSLGGLIVDFIAFVASDNAVTAVREYLKTNRGAVLIVGIMNLALLSLCFFVWWWLGVCARAITGMGLKKYIRERSLIYRIFPFIKGQCRRLWQTVEHMDLTRNSHKLIIRLVLVNALILFLISTLWVGGWGLTIVYSILLYVILRKYVSDLQKRYGILLKAVDQMAEGNLNVTINEDLGVFEPFKPQVIKIQSGFKKAVDEEVKSQRMKAELITNVSHDLKTPLTAIITYVNLLKDESITNEQRKEYLDTLERKSMRLKALIEDLFEVSKANSQNITLNIMDLDIMNLVKQVAFEMKDKLDDSGLDIRMNLTDEKVIIPLDSQKTYRIYENLFGNIAKYAMYGTRVYVNGFRIDDTVVITLKNISAQEITVESSELTERFVRGDASRNTEGSGLGLAIAKSFAELQGGNLDLEVDGDLFKVTTTWRCG